MPIFLIVFIVTIAAFLVGYHIFDHLCKCGSLDETGGRCKKLLWSRITDVSPSGPNPLRIKIRQRVNKCKECGQINILYDFGGGGGNMIQAPVPPQYGK